MNCNLPLHECVGSTGLNDKLPKATPSCRLCLQFMSPQAQFMTVYRQFMPEGQFICFAVFSVKGVFYTICS